VQSSLRCPRPCSSSLDRTVLIARRWAPSGTFQRTGDRDAGCGPSLPLSIQSGSRRAGVAPPATINWHEELTGGPCPRTPGMSRLPGSTPWATCSELRTMTKTGPVWFTVPVGSRGSATAKTSGVPKALRRIQRERRAAGQAPLKIALFRPRDPAVTAQIAGLFVGAAAIGGASRVTGQPVDTIMKLFSPAPNDRRGLSHRVLVSVDAQEVRVYASNRQGICGPQIATYPSGAFRADISHFPGEIELTLSSADQGRMVLNGHWGPLRRSCARVAHAAVALSSQEPPEINSGGPKSTGQ